MPDATLNDLELLVDEVLACAASLRYLEGSPQNDNQLSLSQQAVLQLIQAESELTVPQIARRRGSSRQNVQVLADRLARAGLVRYVPNPDHRRSERLELREFGRRALQSARRTYVARLNQLGLEADTEELHACVEVLQRLRIRLGGKQSVAMDGAARRRLQQPKARVPKGGATPMTITPEAEEESMPEVAAGDELPVTLL